jgi:hypothetical protein
MRKAKSYNLIFVPKCALREECASGTIEVVSCMKEGIEDGLR